MKAGKGGKKGGDKDPPKPTQPKATEAVGSPTKTPDPKKNSTTTTPKGEAKNNPTPVVSSPAVKGTGTKQNPTTGTGTKAPPTKAPDPKANPATIKGRPSATSTTTSRTPRKGTKGEP